MQGLAVYIGDASRTLLEKRLSEHKNAVKKHDTNNGLQPTLGTTNTTWTGGCRDKRNVKNTGKKRTGTPTHPSTAAHLQLEVWCGHRFLATAA